MKQASSNASSKKESTATPNEKADYSIKPSTYYIDSFAKWAHKYAQEGIATADIEKEDRTELFYDELRLHIERDELINISILGQVRVGKSTLGFSIGHHIAQLLVQTSKRKPTYTFGLANIARDQFEFTQKMSNPKLGQTIIVTDEDNELEDQRENSSIQRSMLNTYSDVHAGRYIHKIMISPTSIQDKNSDVIIEARGKDTATKTTYCILSYRILHNGSELIQPIGHITIPVGHIIQRWLTIEKIYYKHDKTNAERERINKAAEEDWYCAYIIRKYEKMELITKHGILIPRMLYYAKAILEIIRKNEVLYQAGLSTTKESVKGDVISTFMKYRLPLTLVGEEEATQSIIGPLVLIKQHYTLRKQIRKYQLTPGAHANEIRLLEEADAILGESVKAQLQHYITMQEIHELYNKSYDEEEQ